MTTPGSRWAEESPYEKALAEQRRQEKQAKKRAKEERQRMLEAEHSRKLDEQAARERTKEQEGQHVAQGEEDPDDREQNVKRRRVDDSDRAPVSTAPTTPSRSMLRFPAREWRPCRHVHMFEKLNRIEEGSYGYVSRARERSSGDVVALKKLKIDRASNDGFPITGLREIQTLSESRHENILHLREVLVGDTLDE